MIYAKIKLMKTIDRILIDKIEFIIIKYNDYYILNRTNNRNKLAYVYRVKIIERIIEVIKETFIREHIRDTTIRYNEIIIKEIKRDEIILYETISRNFWEEDKDEYIKNFEDDLNRVIKNLLNNKDTIINKKIDDYRVGCIIEDEKQREIRQKLIKSTNNDITRRLPIEIVNMICNFM